MIYAAMIWATIWTILHTGAYDYKYESNYDILIIDASVMMAKKVLYAVLLRRASFKNLCNQSQCKISGHRDS